MSVPGKISVVMPYWERADAAMSGLISMSQHYRNGGERREDLEVVLVDDGSPTQPARNFVRGASLGFEVRLVELPVKNHPMCPVTPMNAGVAASDGEYVVLTSPEITHRMPILDELRRECAARGPKAYVHAAVWCPDSGSWHTHYASGINAGYHFLSMMRRSLWDECGGMDEAYRLGACYDDPDLVQRLLRVGAKFFWRDDLIADHHKLGATIHWPRELWDRNKALFESKWPNPKAIDGTPLSYAKLQNWRDGN